MGWSCSAAASFTLGEIQKAQEAAGCKTSNGIMMNDKHVAFWETGTEQEDGAITGSVYALTHNGESCNYIGGFRIESNGYVTRFPRISRRVATMCQHTAAKRFREVYGDAQADHSGVIKHV